MNTVAIVPHWKTGKRVWKEDFQKNKTVSSVRGGWEDA